MAAAVVMGSPVRTLFELCVNFRCQPKFELLEISGKQHSPVFSYKVTVEGVTAEGSGGSKQKAKNAAAEAMLYKMLHDPYKKFYMEKTGAVKNISCTFEEHEEISGDPVGALQQLSNLFNLPHPHYALVGEDSPQNCRFTIACSMLWLRETGTGSSKQKAEAIAAKKMHDKLDRMFLSSLPPAPGLDKLGKRIQDLELHYRSLKGSRVPTLIAPVKEEIIQYYNDMTKNKMENLIDLQNLSCSSPTFNSVQYLQDIAEEQQFVVSYLYPEQKSSCGDFQCLVQISTVHLVCYGHGATLEEAMFSASQCALQYLKLITKS